MYIFNLSGVQTCSPKDCPIYVNSVGQFLLFHILNKLGIVRFLSFYSFIFNLGDVNINSIVFLISNPLVH